MKTKVRMILLFSLLVSACGNTTAAPSAEKPAAMPASSSPKANVVEAAETKTATEIATQPSARKAALSEVEKTVQARATQDDKSAPASAGMTILPGGGVETGGGDPPPDGG